MSHGGETNTIEARARKLTNEELARVFTCSLILHGLSDNYFPCVLTYQDDPRQSDSYYVSATVEVQRSENNSAFIFGTDLQHWTGNAIIHRKRGTYERLLDIDIRCYR